MKYPSKIDLHIHTNLSDGTDTPKELVQKILQSGIGMFSVTDHDGMTAIPVIRGILASPGFTERVPVFINGIEFSCRDDGGKYHILGYGYEETSPSMLQAVETSHRIRMDKVQMRLAALKETFGFTFRQADLDTLLQNANPGKPHIANLMVRYGYAKSKEDAMKNYLNACKIPSRYLSPNEAIQAIRRAGGIPVLAHPFFGDGDQLILGEEMERRITRLMADGLEGLEAYYSGFTPALINKALELADRYGLYVTAGSDYHGANKLVALGDTNVPDCSCPHQRLDAFLKLFLKD